MDLRLLTMSLSSIMTIVKYFLIMPNLLNPQLLLHRLRPNVSLKMDCVIGHLAVEFSSSIGLMLKDSLIVELKDLKWTILIVKKVSLDVSITCKNMLASKV